MGRPASTAADLDRHASRPRLFLASILPATSDALDDLAARRRRFFVGSAPSSSTSLTTRPASLVRTDELVRETRHSSRSLQARRSAGRAGRACRRRHHGPVRDPRRRVELPGSAGLARPSRRGRPPPLTEKPSMRREPRGSNTLSASLPAIDLDDDRAARTSSGRVGSIIIGYAVRELDLSPAYRFDVLAGQHRRAPRRVHR